MINLTFCAKQDSGHVPKIFNAASHDRVSAEDTAAYRFVLAYYFGIIQPLDHRATVDDVAQYDLVVLHKVFQILGVAQRGNAVIEYWNGERELRKRVREIDDNGDSIGV